MQQTELHLVGSLESSVRSAPSGDQAGGMAPGLLRRSGEETGPCSTGRSEETSRGRMEEKSAATVAFVIPGTPVGKGRPKFARRGNFVTAYTPERTASYENLVKVKAEEAMHGRRLFEGAVSVEIALFVTPPASWSQKKQREALAGAIFPTSKPDIDNVLKGIMDACNEIVFRDDKQACDVRVIKRYGDVARACVEVRAL